MKLMTILSLLCLVNYAYAERIYAGLNIIQCSSACMVVDKTWPIDLEFKILQETPDEKTWLSSFQLEREFARKIFYADIDVWKVKNLNSGEVKFRIKSKVFSAREYPAMLYPQGEIHFKQLEQMPITRIAGNPSILEDSILIPRLTLLPATSRNQHNE